MDSKSLLMIALGGLIAVCGVLAVVAFRLWRGLNYDRVERERRELAHRDHLMRSIGLLAQTTVAGELSLSEAAIRSKMLLDHLLPGDNDEAAEAREQYAAIYALHDATEGFARKEDRDALSPRERHEQDHKRELLEELHREGVMANMNSILQHGFLVSNQPDANHRRAAVKPI